jgi:hypothetical protein
VSQQPWIFNTEENLKPHKMPKTDEEALPASVPEEKKTVDTQRP